MMHVLFIETSIYDKCEYFFRAIYHTVMCHVLNLEGRNFGSQIDFPTNAETTFATISIGNLVAKVLGQNWSH